MAHRGTLFLDEIGDLPLSLQAKILRALEEKRFERVGGTASVQVDVRLVAATNRGLRAAVAARRFREDLFFRLSVFPITVPPLRERPGDIPMLARYFVDRFCRDMKKKPLALSPAALEQLSSYRWPGNVRELQNCIERAVILADGDTILPRHLNLSFVVEREPRAAGSVLGADRSERHRCPKRRGGPAVVEKREDRAGAAGSGQQQGPRRGAAADQLQDAPGEAQGAPDRVACAEPVAGSGQPDALRRRLQFLNRHVGDRSSSRRSRWAARSAAFRRPPSCRARSPRRPVRRAGRPPAAAVPSARSSAASASRSAAGNAPRATARFGRREHAVGDRLAVAEAAVLRDRLEGVAERCGRSSARAAAPTRARRLHHRAP